MEYQNVSEASKRETVIINDIQEHLCQQINTLNLSINFPRSSTPKPFEEISPTDESSTDDIKGYQKFLINLTTKKLEPKLRGNLRPSGFIGGHLVMKGISSRYTHISNRSRFSCASGVRRIEGNFRFQMPVEYFKIRAEKLLNRNRRTNMIDDNCVLY